MKDVIIFGTSGHAKVIADIIIKSEDTLLGFLDNGDVKEVDGIPVLGNDEAYADFPKAEFVIGVGDAEIRERLSKYQCRWYTAVHPSAAISSIGVSIGEGTVVMPNAVINSDAKIGKHCIINTGAIVEHDNSIGDFAHVSVGAKLGGNVIIGRKTWIGIGACIKNNVCICDKCTIGAGAVVVKDISEQGEYIGIPASKLYKE